MSTKKVQSGAASESRRYAAVIELAKATVDQWDNHDRYRQTEADRSLFDPQIGEPDGVAIARALLNTQEREYEIMRIALQNRDSFCSMSDLFEFAKSQVNEPA